MNNRGDMPLYRQQRGRRQLHHYTKYILFPWLTSTLPSSPSPGLSDFFLDAPAYNENTDSQRLYDTPHNGGHTYFGLVLVAGVEGATAPARLRRFQVLNSHAGHQYHPSNAISGTDTAGKQSPGRYRISATTTFIIYIQNTCFDLRWHAFGCATYIHVHLDNLIMFRMSMRHCTSIYTNDVEQKKNPTYIKHS